MWDLVTSSGQKAHLQALNIHAFSPTSRSIPLAHCKLPHVPPFCRVSHLTHSPAAHVRAQVVSPGQGEASHLFPRHRGGRGAPGLIAGASAEGLHTPDSDGEPGRRRPFTMSRIRRSSLRFKRPPKPPFFFPTLSLHFLYYFCRGEG